MQCPKCNTELKINRITKVAECMSCHQYYHLKFRKVNLLAWLACVVILAVIVSRILVLIAGGNQYILGLLVIMFNIGICFFIPKELLNNFLYKVCKEEKE